MSDGDIWAVQQADGSVRFAYDEENSTNVDSRARKDTTYTDMNKMGSQAMLQDAVTSHVLHSMVSIINFVVMPCVLFVFALLMIIMCFHLRFCTG